MNSLKFPAFYRQVAWLRGSAAKNNRTEFSKKAVRGITLADFGIRHKLDPLLCHEVNATLYYFLVEVWIGNPVHKQSPNAVVTLKYGHPVTCFVELCRACESGWSRTHNSNPLSRTFSGRLRNYPTFLKTPINYRALNALDCNRRLIDTENTGRLTGCGTDPAGKLRKIVSLVEAIERFSPKPSID
jgi:hypothetical protein